MSPESTAPSGDKTEYNKVWHSGHNDLPVSSQSQVVHCDATRSLSPCFLFSSVSPDIFEYNPTEPSGEQAEYNKVWQFCHNSSRRSILSSQSRVVHCNAVRCPSPCLQFSSVSPDIFEYNPTEPSGDQAENNNVWQSCHNDPL